MLMRAQTIDFISLSQFLVGGSMPKSPQSEPENGVVESVQAFDPNLSPSHLLHRAQQIATDLHTATFGLTGLTQRQLAVLVALGSKDGISQTDLVLQTGIDRSTLAEMVARMETKGLVARAKSATDSRANAVSLTDAGQGALDDAIPKLQAIDKAVLALLPASRRDGLVGLLTRIALPTTEKTKSKKKDKKKKDRKKKKVEKTS
jgi:MarR family transcriptional regulator, temperature-dependent positive regulator of motility